MPSVRVPAAPTPVTRDTYYYARAATEPRYIYRLRLDLERARRGAGMFGMIDDGL